jgi:hypothetical protein
VVHRIKVRREWLTVGEVVELELPRNLACAACGGGGCDTCGRSRGITLRIPEQGGLPPPNSDLPRGVLLLTVVPSPHPDPSVKLLRGVPSKRPPASIVESDEMPARLPVPDAKRAVSIAIIIVTVAVVLWILLLTWLRWSGHG